MAGRSSIVVKLARKFQALPLWLLRFFEWPFVAFFANRQGNTISIFILALPRSGSTVTYQSICHGLQVNYLSNLWSLFYQLPLLGGWLSARKAHYHRSDFKSQHGFVSGLDGPAEGMLFWRWWLDCGLSDCDCWGLPVTKRKRRLEYLRDVLSTLAKQGQPFATAYLGHTLMPDGVNEAFPGAILVRLRREPVANALSLLKSSRESGSGWFSVKPQECDGLENATLHERVAAQVYWLNRRLDDAHCSGKMFAVDYEQLCKNPEKEVDRIRDWCRQKGVVVERKFELPKSFPFRKADLNADPDAIQIRNELDKLEAKHGKLKVAE